MNTCEVKQTMTTCTNISSMQWSQEFWHEDAEEKEHENDSLHHLNIVVQIKPHFKQMSHLDHKSLGMQQMQKTLRLQIQSAKYE